MRFFKNVRRTKTIVWLLNALTILGVLFVLVGIVKKERAGEFEPRKSEVFKKKLLSKISSDERNVRRSRNILKYSSLWKARIDGSVRKDPNAEKKVEPKEYRPENEPIGNVIEIGSILCTPDAPERSRVRLRYLKEDKLSEEKSLVLKYWSREGDPLKAPFDKEPSLGKVLRIEKSQVVFSWFGKEAALSPPAFESAADAAMGSGKDGKDFPEDPMKRYRKKPPEETVEVAPDQYALSTKEYKEITSKPEVQLKTLSLTKYTNPETGATSIKVGDVEENSIAYRRGVRRGDVLISINGIPVSSKAAAINYFKQHPNEGRYQIEIDRMGRRVFKTFYYDN